MEGTSIFKRVLSMLLSLSLAFCLIGCGADKEEEIRELTVTGSLELRYATQFSIDYCEGGYKLISLADGSRFLIIPEGSPKPKGLDPGTVPIYQPVRNIYLAATSVMCLFDSLDRLDAIRLSGTKEDGWYIEAARQAMRDGNILFAGKYSAPDYELITAEKCPLAIESMMIGHASDVKEQLEQLGIAVLMDQSSNEDHPLGRVEWIKLYGALLGEEEAADRVFQEQLDYLDSVSESEASGKTVAFFYVSSTGRIITRKSGDYVSKMIELAGGQYVLKGLDDDGSMTSSITLDPEFFYANARDADVIIYNSAIAGEVTDIESLISMCELLGDFRAIESGEVWCTEKNMYQEMTASGEMIREIHDILSGNYDEESGSGYLRRLH
ncbi:MAG: ABC transporter substrate-binding protein [Oscillospiraceae bacterium]|nr:ABC transporter substrate-binding protein [Oscillospiraceae bacterium]